MNATDTLVVLNGAGSSIRPATGPFRVVANRLVDAAGTPQCLVGPSSFALPYLMLTNRPKALAWLDWMTSRGGRIGRTFSMWANPGGIQAQLGTNTPFDPRVDGYWPARIDLANAFAARGAVELATHLADCQFAPLMTLDQPGFLALADLQLGSFDTELNEAGNEYGSNGWNPFALTKPTVGLWSRGSAGGEAQPISPPWDLWHYESSRADDFPRRCKDLQDNYIGANANPPVFPNAVRFLDFPSSGFMGEPIGIGDIAESGRTTNDPFKVWEFVAGSKAFGASIVILHLRCGITCDIPAAGSLTEQCYDAGVAAGQLPFSDFVFAPFQHGGLHDSNPNVLLRHEDVGYPGAAGASRTDQLGPLADGRFLLMVFEPEPQWSAQWRQPVTVLQSFVGPGETRATMFIVRP